MKGSKISGSAIKSTASGAPARPFIVANCFFKGFDKAIYSEASNTGICQVLIQGNTFYLNNYSVYAKGPNAIMDMDFRNNVSEQGGRIGSEDSGFGGTINISDNLLEGQNDALNLKGGKFVVNITRNYFESNTGKTIQVSCTNNASKINIHNNHSAANNEVPLIYIRGGIFKTDWPSVIDTVSRFVDSTDAIYGDFNSSNKFLVYSSKISNIIERAFKYPDNVFIAEFPTGNDTPTPLGIKKSIVGDSSGEIETGLTLPDGGVMVVSILLKIDSDENYINPEFVIKDQNNTTINLISLLRVYPHRWENVVYTYKNDHGHSLDQVKIEYKISDQNMGDIMTISEVVAYTSNPDTKSLYVSNPFITIT